MYEEILKIAIDTKLIESYGLEIRTIVNTKYKTVAKKVRLVAIQLRLDSEDHIKKAEKRTWNERDRKNWTPFPGRNMGPV